MEEEVISKSGKKKFPAKALIAITIMIAAFAVYYKPTWDRVQFQKTTNTDFSAVSSDIDMEDLGDMKDEYNKAKEVLAKDEYNLDANISKADILSRTGEYDKATVIYEKMAKMYPSDARAFNRLGAVYAYQKKYTEAENSFLTAIKLQPQDAATYIELANLYLATKEESTNREKVTRFYEEGIKALADGKDNMVLVETYAKSLERVGDYAKAIEKWNVVLAASPDDQFIKDKIAELQSQLPPVAPALVPAQ